MKLNFISSLIGIVTGLTVAFSIPTFAQTDVTGSVDGHWIANNSPYYVIGDVSLSPGDTLIIDPGVVIQFSNAYRFDVYGLLIAEGTEEDSIRFFSGGHITGVWTSLRFFDSMTDHSILDYCVIQNANRGIELDNADIHISNSNISYHSGLGIRITGSSPVISDCIISETGGSGIHVEENSYPIIQNCAISVSVDHGVAVRDQSRIILRNSSITQVQDHGVDLTTTAACSLRSNIITLAGEKGIAIQQNNGTILFRNIVSQTGGPGIWAQRSTNLSIINSTTINNDTYGIQLYETPAIINGNVVAFNGSDGILNQTGAPRLSYNDVYGNDRENYNGVARGNTDIIQDPLLDNDFFPNENSPLIDAGDPRYRDPDGTDIDIGARFYNQNHAPLITYYYPENLGWVDINQEVEFSVRATDEDEHQFTITWFVNNERVGEGNSILHTFTEEGEAIVRVVVDDGYYMGRTEHIWDFPVSVDEDVPEIPVAFAITGLYPNPFNAHTKIMLSIPHQGHLTITARDQIGRLVSTVWDNEVSAGAHSYIFDGEGLPTGQYFIRARLGNNLISNTLTLIK